MKNLLLIAAALISMSALGAHTDELRAVSIADTSAADQVIEGLVEGGGLPFVYARVEDASGRVAYEHGAVNRALVPMDIDGRSWIRIWSMSKIVTISIAMDLVEDGVLSLDDPVMKYLPEFAGLEVAVGADGEPLTSLRDKASACPLERVPVKTSMTVRHLITHQDGLYYPWSGISCLDEPFGKANLPAVESSDELIRRLAALPLIHQPGEADFYGTGTTVLGLVLQRATGRTLQQLVEERVTGPMHIEGLRYGLPSGARLPPRISGAGDTLHPATPGELDIFGTQLPEYGPDYPLYLGGEGMIGTADGYADFARMLLHRGRLNGYRMLEEATIEEMTAPHTQLDSEWGHNGYNLWISNGRLSDGSQGPGPLWIGGGYEGTHFWIDPQRDLVGVIMTQVFNAPKAAANFHERIRMAIYRGMGFGE